MRNYLFILGRDPKLSVLEILSFLERKGLEHFLIENNEFVCIISLPEGTNTTSIINDLGGTVKIGREISSLNELVIEKNKISYGVTQIKCDSSRVLKQFNQLFKRERVKAVRKYGVMEDIPPSKSKNLDIEIVVYKNRLFHVVALSNPWEYKKRDVKRPVFDPLRETSIRLAKILVNLAGARNEILDPFCGTGTILQEALLMGYSVIGIDASIRDAKKNIAWLGNAYAGKARLLQGDARNASEHVRKVEAIVTEPYLGPYIRKTLEKRQAIAITSNLERLYLSFLKDAHNIVHGRVVMVIPRFRTLSGIVALDFDAILNKAGFRMFSPLQEVKIPILYWHKGSKIERLIYILEKL